MSDITNTFLATYELGKVIGAKEEQIRLIRLVKEIVMDDNEIGPYVFVKDLLDYLENDYDKQTH